MKPKIKLLSPDLINKIAAGEVVERPSSVVKELIENSLDAGSDTITIRIENGGINYIEVSDNGEGMLEQDAKLALSAHATSKITSTSDLENIITLGFRGEALASISSVSETIIHTKTATENPIQVTKTNERIVSTPAKAKNTGTNVIVKNLFAQIPARKKFLKSEASEYRSILSVFTKIALINPKINFQLFHNDKLIYSLKSGKFQDRVNELFPGTLSNLIEVYFDDPEIKIQGFVGHPKINRKDRKNQFLFINKRPINNALLSQAIKSGFGTNLMQKEQPVYFIEIIIPPDKVDVNVHPRKDEVRLTNEQLVFKNVFKTVRNALEKALHAELKERVYSPTNSFSQIPDYKIPLNNQRKTMPKNVSQSIDFTRTLLETPIKNIQEDIYQILQIFKTYLVVQIKEELLVIDQHAAAERISFEKIEKCFEEKQNLPSQSLLIPEVFKLSPEESEAFRKFKDIFEKLGFTYTINEDKLNITSIPDLLKEKSLDFTVRELLQEFNERKVYKKEESEFLKKIIATIACHGSIRAGQEINEFQARQLVSDLLKCKQPYSCPHGRPIIWSLSQYEIEKHFKRK